MEKKEKLQVFLLGSLDTKRAILSILSDNSLVEKLLELAKNYDAYDLKVIQALAHHRLNSAHWPINHMPV